MISLTAIAAALFIGWTANRLYKLARGQVSRLAEAAPLPEAAARR